MTYQWEQDAKDCYDLAIACKRVEEATRQPDLFIEQPKAPEQTGLDLE